MPHRPRVYWVDFVVSLAVAYACLWLYLTSPLASPAKAVGFLGAGFALYRLSVFTHEIAHFRRGTFAGFRLAWNALLGVPCLMPSFLYADHVSHHVNHSYGTKTDAEYYPLGRGPLSLVLGYFAQTIVLPVGAVVRFGLLSPLSHLMPPLRRFVWERASSIASMNPYYRRPAASVAIRREALVAEAACFAWIAGVAVLLVTGVVPWSWLLQLYLLFAFVTLMNYTRALGAHRYLNAGEPMSYRDQLLDSTTIPGSPLTVLWAPLGMRYHALHHLVPSLPYHAMAAAHRRLMDQLPDDSPYRQTLRTGLVEAIADVVRNASRGARHHAS
ncbi:MAG: fatty acid desaturase [Planctomycetota bacterium]